jgi:hypothetical protein
MSLRKTRLVPAEPKVGRYRLFDWLPKGWRRCRACGRRVRADHQWAHHVKEWRKWHDEPGRLDMCPWDGRKPCHLALRLAFNLRARRSRRNRAHAQYQYATKGEPWRKR